LIGKKDQREHPLPPYIEEHPLPDEEDEEIIGQGNIIKYWFFRIIGFLKNIVLKIIEKF